MAKVFLDFAALTNSTTMARQRRRMTAAQEAMIQALASPRRNQDTTLEKVRLSPSSSFSFVVVVAVGVVVVVVWGVFQGHFAVGGGIRVVGVVFPSWIVDVSKLGRWVQVTGKMTWAVV